MLKRVLRTLRDLAVDTVEGVRHLAIQTLTYKTSEPRYSSRWAGFLLPSRASPAVDNMVPASARNFCMRQLCSPNRKRCPHGAVTAEPWNAVRTTR